MCGLEQLNKFKHDFFDRNEADKIYSKLDRINADIEEIEARKQVLLLGGALLLAIIQFIIGIVYGIFRENEIVCVVIMVISLVLWAIAVAMFVKDRRYTHREMRRLQDTKSSILNKLNQIYSNSSQIIPLKLCKNIGDLESLLENGTANTISEAILINSKLKDNR